MLVVLSDIHDNLVNLDKALTWAQDKQAQALLILGDLTNSDTLAHLAKHWTKTIYLVQGNCDLYDSTEPSHYPQIKNLGRQGGVITIESVKIGLCHEPQLLIGLLPDQPDIVFYGHTHVPWEEQKLGIRFVNPGNVAGVRNEASFASYQPDTNELNLHRLNEL